MKFLLQLKESAGWVLGSMPDKDSRTVYLRDYNDQGKAQTTEDIEQAHEYPTWEEADAALNEWRKSILGLR